MKTCKCGEEMYPDSYEHPRKPVEWVWRCRVCGENEASTEEEAFIAFEEMKERYDARK